MVITRSKTGNASDGKQATLEDFDVATQTKQRKSAAAKGSKSRDTQPKTTQSSRKRKAHQPPSPPPAESMPSDNPIEDGRPRKVPKGSTPSDPVGAARRAAETRKQDPRGGAPEARSKGQSGHSAKTAQNGTKSTKTEQKASKEERDSASKDDEGEEEEDKSIMINRAPVLSLWAACVTAFLYPDVKWEACLSAGATIATLCAISKGRAVGKVDPPDDTAEKKAEKKHKREKDKQSSPQVLDVMSFPLPLNSKDGSKSVMMSGKPKPQSEPALVGKFGGEGAYRSVREAMEEGLKSWNDDQNELNRKAFGMYEKFRPGVPSGGQGWGRKGELRLEKIGEVVKKG